MQRLALRSVQLTAILLVASVALIGPALAGLGASIPLAVVLFGAGALLFAGRRDLGAIGIVRWIPLGPTLRVAWIGPLLAALIALLASGASPGELQALGGLCGLAGMVNYFLRPVYGLLVAAGRYVRRTVDGARGH